MVKKSVPEGLAAELRRAIEASGLSLNQIGQRAGMDHSRLSRFMRGERGLTVDAVERIGEVLGLRLTLSEGAAELPPREAPPKRTPRKAGPPAAPTTPAKKPRRKGKS